MHVNTNYSIPNNSTKFTGSISANTYSRLIKSVKTGEDVCKLIGYTLDGIPGPKSFVVDIVKEVVDGAQRTFFDITNANHPKWPKVRVKASNKDLPYNLDTLALFSREHVKKVQNVWNSLKKS